MCDVTLDWEDHGRFPPQGVPPAGKDAAKERRDRHVGLSASGRGNEGSVAGGGGDICTPPP